MTACQFKTVLTKTQAKLTTEQLPLCFRLRDFRLLVPVFDFLSLLSGLSACIWLSLVMNCVYLDLDSCLLSWTVYVLRGLSGARSS